MFGLSRDVFIGLMGLLRKIAESPFEHRAECLELQNALFNHIVAAERRIGVHRKNIRETKSRITKALGKIVAKQLQNNVERWQSRVEDHQQTLHILRCIGDGLAFLHLDKWDIKPMAFKEAPGFISGKSGTSLERGILQQVFDGGGVAIQNDLTNCLRYGDITIPHEGFFKIVEAKSGQIARARDERQLKSLVKITEYLIQDKADGVYGIPDTVHRQAVEGSEISRRDAMNDLIKRSYAEGSVSDKVEDGLYYLVAVDSNFSELEALTAQVKSALAWTVNDLKFKNVGYYPFTLSIEDPIHLYDFYTGGFMLAVVVDLAVVRSRFAAAGWRMTYIVNDADPWMMKLEADEQSEEKPNEIRVSRHFWHRLAAEFVGLDWLIAQSMLPWPAADGDEIS
jgi:hypothetical protein